MICENCGHKPVCDRFKATGGVKACEHHIEERRGHWIRRGNERKCSCCGFIYFSNDAGFNGCPNCLADMRGEET